MHIINATDVIGHLLIVKMEHKCHANLEESLHNNNKMNQLKEAEKKASLLVQESRRGL
jgi:hypothetical protein